MLGGDVDAYLLARAVQFFLPGEPQVYYVGLLGGLDDRELFARTGFAETSVQDVAEEAGVVPTAVYYHFAGKDELFDVALQSVITELDEVVDRARPEGDHDQAAALPQIVT